MVSARPVKLANRGTYDQLARSGTMVGPWSSTLARSGPPIKPARLRQCAGDKRHTEAHRNDPRQGNEVPIALSERSPSGSADNNSGGQTDHSTSTAVITSARATSSPASGRRLKAEPKRDRVPAKLTPSAPSRRRRRRRRHGAHCEGSSATPSPQGRRRERGRRGRQEIR